MIAEPKQRKMTIKISDGFVEIHMVQHHFVIEVLLQYGVIGVRIGAGIDETIHIICNRTQYDIAADVRIISQALLGGRAILHQCKVEHKVIVR